MNSKPFLSDILQYGVLLWFSGAQYDPTTVQSAFAP
jgi:hypothetical protein